jgi:hypothetical protein
VSLVERFNQAERNYVNCIQRESESLAEFYERFKGTVRVMHQHTADASRNIPGSPGPEIAAAKFITNLNSAGIERPSVSILFVDNLHDQRFTHFKSKLKNDTFAEHLIDNPVIQHLLPKPLCYTILQ